MKAQFSMACGALIAVTCITLSCSPATPPAPVKQEPKTWGGDLTPVVPVKELMRDLIDPVADNIFDAVGIEVTATGTREWRPKTDEDWAKVRVGAVAMAEASYLLKIPRPFTRPGDENNSTGPDASELSPAQAKAKLEKDPVLWEAKIEALRNVGKEVLAIVEKKDAQALWDAGDDLDSACENCHLEYWYPNQKELMGKLDAQVLEMRKESDLRKQMREMRKRAPAK